ncbi:4-hydroxythreonine-4-phosphate dehydrogenase PdxA [Cyanobium sp. Morenito 9A2]|uniref:4-hydroxythreonine-4-phosphate dehydrogenase PdxA n=1 Tax=Cyanobium sp. Morenito 9A2 TaxID=2823718 RepID=UPI0020CC8103|nr:4-hydroxythreonine-4-phosphate dehydrogenase PdxA [Cyanobium sp. Morenito 9A2]MCP9850285.1 4-hydroxythreonine-4-phosphate dehydrogenase PdxA [Cyanobium sp. Morenito 9A2]
MNRLSTTPDINARRIAISVGDPAGIGAEVTLKALPRLHHLNLHPVLVGCRRHLKECFLRLSPLSTEPLIDPETLEIIDLPLQETVPAGEGTAISGQASFRWLTVATERVLSGDCQALVTAPIAKHAWHAAGHRYPGQTERLAEMCGVAEASMLFTARSPHGPWRLNTLLATTHLPLAQVPGALNPGRVTAKLEVLRQFCQRFNPTPQLLVAGLNPHAGEAGALGDEEVSWLIPLLERWRSQHPEVDLIGPLPPDTCWLSAAEAWHRGSGGPDGYLALYHDQGLIPVKLLAFDAAVNTSLGLPFLRTSPDHGTGFSIAGQGLARPESMQAALETALELRPA